MSELLSVVTALEQILAQLPQPSTESIASEHALNRILAEKIYSRVNLPPFANSAMDGYAVRSADTAQAPTQLQVIMDIPAGTAPEGTLQAGQAARIMTGAPLPEGADAVIPVEDTSNSFAPGADAPLETNVTLKRSVQTGDNVRQVGENVREGDLILAVGTALQPQDIGMLVAIGAAQIQVYRQPRVVILGTGDELIGIEEPLQAGKIRDTNSYTIAGMVTLNGGQPLRLPPAKDTLEDVRRLFQQALTHQPDILVSTAGVSVGTYDVVRSVMDELGEIGFWRVNVRPGKPLAFGQIQGIPFFGLPGNPVSAMVTFDLFVRPALLKLAGKHDDASTIQAVVGEDMTSDGRRTYTRVKLTQVDGQIVATSTGTQSSGALMSMVLADGLLIIPEGVKSVQKGEKLPVRLLRK